MSDPVQFNPQQLISTVTARSFATMLSMKIQASFDAMPLPTQYERIIASVGFGGRAMVGDLSITVTNEFAKLIAAAMLGLYVEEIQVPNDINDVMSELVNVMGGNCLAALGELGYVCGLSLPTVTRGVGLRTEIVRGARRECVAFHCERDQFVVSMDLKSQ